jgi:hypothetical protein
MIHCFEGVAMGRVLASANFDEAECAVVPSHNVYLSPAASHITPNDLISLFGQGLAGHVFAAHPEVHAFSHWASCGAFTEWELACTPKKNAGTLMSAGVFESVDTRRRI